MFDLLHLSLVLGELLQLRGVRVLLLLFLLPGQHSKWLLSRIDHMQCGLAIHGRRLYLVHPLLLKRAPHCVNIQVRRLRLLRVLSGLVTHPDISINEFFHLILDVLLIVFGRFSESRRTHATISIGKITLSLINW